MTVRASPSALLSKLILAAVIALYQTNEENKIVQDSDVFAKGLISSATEVTVPAVETATAQTTAADRAPVSGVRELSL
ncbi:hypothetical protein [Caballeronia sp. AZ7_KS35]|uniref:hypothetical protein n=1 Tax=Caballeronia sp. AZ7_KS35 TaxID=2921762 RepID=UPI002027D1D1|nr:hypothetical protein [Caballeronia sp. AZ7_KS35]